MTDHVPAAAKGMPKITRRTVLAGSVATVALAGAGTAAQAFSAERHDPMLVALRKYRADIDYFNSPATTGMPDKECDALRDATWGSFWTAGCHGDVPPVTSETGAIECIRATLREGDVGQFETALLTAALAYFDGRA